jgi:molecular chaperone GrpE (heat shock protein)
MFRRKDNIPISEDLTNMSSVLNRNLKNYNSEVKIINSDLKNLQDEIINLKNLFVSLNSELTEKENELKKYKKGYQKTVLKGFFNKLIDINELASNLSTSSSEKDIHNLKNYILFTLQELDIEEFSPTVNEDFRTQNGVNAHSDVVKTGDKSKNGKVVKALKKGYKVTLDDGSLEIIQNAVAQVYKFVEEKK